MMLNNVKASFLILLLPWVIQAVPSGDVGRDTYEPEIRETSRSSQATENLSIVEDTSRLQDTSSTSPQPDSRSIYHPRAAPGKLPPQIQRESAVSDALLTWPLGIIRDCGGGGTINGQHIINFSDTTTLDDKAIEELGY